MPGVETIAHAHENGPITIMFVRLRDHLITGPLGRGTEEESIIPVDKRQPGSRSVIVFKDVYEICSISPIPFLPPSRGYAVTNMLELELVREINPVCFLCLLTQTTRRSTRAATSNIPAIRPPFLCNNCITRDPVPFSQLNDILQHELHP